LMFHHPKPGMPLRDAIDPSLAAIARLANGTLRERSLRDSAAAQTSAGDPEAWEALTGHLPELEADGRAQLLETFADAVASAPLPAL